MAGDSGHAHVRQCRPVRSVRPARRCTRSTSSPATTASRSGTSSPTTTSTTRPTAKTIATAWTRTSAGTAASKGRRDDPDVLRLRKRQAKNLLTTLMLSQGVPMLLAGDEFLRTQKGNNNAWCQDNEMSWIDWRLPRRNADFFRFTQHADRPAQTPSRPAAPRLLPRQRARPATCDPTSSGTASSRSSPISPPGSRTLAFCLDGTQTGREPDRDFYVACNAWIDPIAFRIPRSPNRPSRGGGPSTPSLLVAARHPRPRRGPALCPQFRLSRGAFFDGRAHFGENPG